MATNAEPVRVESGLLTGGASRDGLVRAFKGVPYARPPLGALRWRPPAPVEAWSGVRPAEKFGPRSVQPDRPPTAIGYFGAEDESEDCLTLNVWTAAASSDERRAVLVWFHGGAYAVGSGALPIFDGAALARKGVVVVTVNYRLGRLGFLAHPELSREAAHRTSGNYGMLDQIAAVAWVGRNIAGFGGDPARVTIFGQSAGSSSVCCMMASPLARGLFHRAIGQSGGALGRRAMLPLDEAERAGHELARALGADIAGLRQRPARELQLVRPDLGGTLKATYDSNDARALDRPTAWANLDGHVLPEPVHDVFARGGQHDVPLLTGSTRHEGSTLPGIPTMQEFVARARSEHGARADAFLALYPAASDDAALAASRTEAGERTFTWENWLWARLHARAARSHSFYYHFSRVPPRRLEPGGGDRSRPLGAYHTAEIPYAFDHLEARDWPWQETDRRLAATMSSYWVNFANSGDPNGPGLPAWLACDEAMRQVMHLGDEIAMGPVPHPERIEFWNGHDESER